MLIKIGPQPTLYVRYWVHLERNLILTEVVEKNATRILFPIQFFCKPRRFNINKQMWGDVPELLVYVYIF
jgi:hypothetical protein